MPLCGGAAGQQRQDARDRPGFARISSMFRGLGIEGLILVTPKRFGDERGYFSEVYVEDRFKAGGVTCDFIQDNRARSSSKGVVRGLHYQAPPAAQAKLIRCTQGAIFDVAVDLREGSPTFGRHKALELSEATGEQLFVPAGFAHGYCTLSENAVVEYKVDAPYAPEAEAGIFWNDPDLGIAWPVAPEAALLSERDKTLPAFVEIDTPFRYKS